METSNISTNDTEQDTRFRADIIALEPKLRTFAFSLSRNAAHADDLVQDTMLKAWEFRAQFQAGTVLKAWMFTILRNRFFDDQRRSRRVCALEPEFAERTLIAVSDPDKILELDELRRAMTCLNVEQREAVMLIGAGGFAYEDAAKICGAGVGTIKSRTSRGRVRLREIMDSGAYPADGVSCGAAMSNIFAQVEQLSQRQAAHG